MDEQLFMNILGFLGTGLVLVSFLMSNIKWLRIINMAGGFLSLIFAIYSHKFSNQMPVIVLNTSLIFINGVKLMRSLRKERENLVNIETNSAYNNEETKEEDI
jgi:hypothetical protein